jgi:hypothetical protein
MRGNVMSSRNLFASVLMAGLLAVGFLDVTPAASAEIGERSVVKPGKSARITVRPRGPRIHLPVGPGSVYCDYPYYYSRGHYPTHIGGYLYYPSYYNRSCWGDDRGPGSSRRARGT